MILTPEQEEQVQSILGKGERVALLWCLVASGRRRCVAPKPFSELLPSLTLADSAMDPNR